MIHTYLDKFQTKLIDLDFEKQTWDFKTEESYRIELTYPTHQRELVKFFLSYYLDLDCIPSVNTNEDGTETYVDTMDCTKFQLKKYLAFRRKIKQIA